ncbi:MAG: hypothetical protein IPO92_05325 [Saprospiraceae bacterium]|nr:hypothetical protein [Saprospiraceae bacterium]
MIKRTIYFGNPAYLSVKNKQLCIRKEGGDAEINNIHTIPIEDIGIVVADRPQITFYAFSFHRCRKTTP